jgi:hypothetical protein
MIKPGKVCSQLMKANNTGETDINVVGKYFRFTFVFNGLKTSLNLCLSSPIALGRKQKGRGRQTLSVEVNIHLNLPRGFIDP